MKASFVAGLILTMAVMVAAPARAEEQVAQASPPTAANYQGDGGVLRMTNNPAGTNAFAVFVMQKFGLDKKYGFQMQVISTGTASAAATAIQAGSADVIVSDMMDLARMRNAGVKVIGIVPMFKWGDHIIVPTDSPIHNLGDLRGKRFGTDSIQNSTWFVMRAAGLKTYNIDLLKDTKVQAGGVGLLRGLMEEGQLDATFIYNNITPAMTVTGKFRVLYQMRDLIKQIGLDGDVPFLLHAASEDYAAKHPANIRAYLAAYREAIQILNVNDDVWMEQGRNMKMADPSIPPLRDEMRQDLMSKFEPNTEAGMRNIFDVLLATGGPESMGMSKLPDVLVTLKYQ
jgi:NitT/TauT family transport system substrate-binding protein